MPASGALTWFGGIRDAADLHEIVFKLGLVIVVLHVLAALSHQFILKDGLLARIVPRFKG